jgi:uncharacterized membrane protein
MLSAQAVERRASRHTMGVQMSIRRLFWVETGLAAITGLLALITPIFPDWIEFVSGWDPDQHDGSVEWLIIVGLLAATVVLAAAAAIEWRRNPAAASA